MAVAPEPVHQIPTAGLHRSSGREVGATLRDGGGVAASDHSGDTEGVACNPRPVWRRDGQPLDSRPPGAGTSCSGANRSSAMIFGRAG